MNHIPGLPDEKPCVGRRLFLSSVLRGRPSQHCSLLQQPPGSLIPHAISDKGRNITKERARTTRAEHARARLLTAVRHTTRYETDPSIVLCTLRCYITPSNPRAHPTYYPAATRLPVQYIDMCERISHISTGPMRLTPSNPRTHATSAVQPRARAVTHATGP